MHRDIYYNEVVVSFHKGIKRTTIQRMETWVIGGSTKSFEINKDKQMMRQLEQRVYPKNYKGQRKILVVSTLSTKCLGKSFYY